ncbi:class I SAM-dependent methyltransferase [Ruminococcaceae bacterium OttesenSCG-928-I18]|nr:class I SAM-dependent methyltransferase [Ruminococcaceae bacterium OttesenSCG-928-I18]
MVSREDPMGNQERLNRFYTEESPEELRLAEGGAQRVEFETARLYLRRYLPAASSVLDSCAGTGVYAFHLAHGGHRVAAGDLVERNVHFLRRHKDAPLLDWIGTLDALDLSGFGDDTFDAVLCMGALYHLHTEKERARAVEESLRVLKPGGLLFATYMNRYAVIQNNALGPLSNLDEILRYAQDGQEGVFYASTPEETSALLRGFALETLCHLSLDGITNFLYTTAGLLDEQGLRRWETYHLSSCEVPSLLGAGYHNMIIGKKPASA